MTDEKSGTSSGTVVPGTMDMRSLRRFARSALIIVDSDDFPDSLRVSIALEAMRWLKAEWLVRCDAAEPTSKVARVRERRHRREIRDFRLRFNMALSRLGVLPSSPLRRES